MSGRKNKSNTSAVGRHCVYLWPLQNLIISTGGEWIGGIIVLNVEFL